jgi:hypothetical protein
MPRKKLDKSIQFLNSKKNLIIISVFVLLIITSCFILFLILKEPESYIIKSNTFGDLIYSGEVIKNKPAGKATIKSEDNNFYLKGTFIEGEFKNGMIIIKTDDKEIYMEGEFKGFLLQEGDIVITTSEERVEKKGEFIDNKLNGLGTLKITSLDNNDLVFVYSGKFKNDTPIYK